MNRDDAPNANEQPDPDEPEPLEIPLPPRRRWAGMTLYFLAFAGVGTLLVLLLVRLGSSLPISIGAVGFMIVGMLLMARWTTRNVL
jgi:hypothetical protein